MTAPGRQKTPPLILPERSEGPGGIYVHIPFCRSKCPYCSFVSFPETAGSLKKGYMEALELQLQDMAGHPWCRARKFRSVYIGGGTPSSIDPAVMACFAGACLNSFDFGAPADSRPEVTIEVNPNAVNRAQLKKYRQAGINRLSIGVQSFSDRLLRAIGRTHAAQGARQVFADARDAGFENISLDLMYGLPGQSVADWRETLDAAVDLNPEHLSVYELTIEENTPFAELLRQKRLYLPEEDGVLRMFMDARDILATSGYIHYEISNYCRTGFQSIHNVNYWENGSYLGLGCGAVSCFSGVRIQNERDPQRFIKMVTGGRKPFIEGEILPRDARFRETVIMGLRMLAGVSIRMLEERFCMTPEKYYGETLNKLIEEGFLEVKQARLRLTAKGVPLANQVMAQLV